MKSLVVFLGMLVLATFNSAFSADGPDGRKFLLGEKLRDFSLRNIDEVSTAGVIGRSCAVIMGRELIYDEFQKLSSRYRVQQHYDWACRSDFSTSKQMLDSSVSLGIPLEGLPTPLKLDSVLKASNFKESLSQWCSTAWSSLADQANYEEYSHVVNQGMVSAYKTCIDAEKETILKKFGAFAYVTPQDDYLRTFVVSLEFRPTVFGTKPPRIVGIEGSDIRCTRNGSALKFPLEINTATTVITCTKAVDDSRIISFNTDPTGATTPVKLPGLSEGVILDLDQRTKGLAQAIQTNRLAQQKTNERFSKIKFHRVPSDIGNCPGCQPGPCPAGFIDTGTIDSDTYPGGGGGHGFIFRVCYSVGE